MQTFRVVLIQMPFAVTSWPSLGISLLKSILKGDGHDVEIAYFNHAFARIVDKDIYDKLARGAPQNVDLAGEWVFSSALWGPDPVNDAAFFREVLRGNDPAHKKTMDNRAVDEICAKLSALRDRVPAFIEQCCDAIDWSEVQVVGFTSTFQQHVASLALAKEFKHRYSHLKILFGGANCEGKMGWATLRNFPFVDAVCLGEGDTAFPAYLRNLANGEPSTPGFITRDDLRDPDAYAKSLRHSPAVNMETLPYPDFDDFFRDANPDDADYRREHRLIFESSRGCWWGQKNHCTFCGLNGGTMGFRQKSGQRAVEEIEFLVGKYGRYTNHLTATDNIMPYNYFSTFLPKLADLKLEISLFYETKANLKKQQVEIYRQAGLTSIQPGIESLSTDVLRLMRKGVSALQNIQLLKWCHEYGIDPKWNYLAGFPGEQAEWYHSLPGLVKHIKHLPPPIGVSTLRFDRFSPYTEHPEDFSVREITPYPAYRYIYKGLEDTQVSEIAYYFTCRFDGDQHVESYVEELFGELNEWKHNSDDYALFHLPTEDGVLVFDARGAEPKIFRLTGIVSKIFEECDAVVSIDTLREFTSDRTTVEDVVDALEALGVFVRDGAQVLNVSIPLYGEYKPPRKAVAKLSRLFADDLEAGGDTNILNIHPDNVALISAETLSNYVKPMEMAS